MHCRNRDGNKPQHFKFEFGSNSIDYWVEFASLRVLAHFTFGFGAVLGKTRVLARLVLAPLWFFPISV